MTTRITKPAFNFREKLTELDYAKIPYEKMPSGSVIQVKQNYHIGQAVYGATNTSTELFGINIFPRLATSSFLVRAHVSYSHSYLGSDNADQGDIFLFLRRNKSTYIGANSNLTRSFGYTNNEAWYKTDVPFSNDAVQHSWGYDTMAQDIEYLDRVSSPDGTGHLRYSVYMMCQNNFELNRAQQNATNGATSFITVMEIKA